MTYCQSALFSVTHFCILSLILSAHFFVTNFQICDLMPKCSFLCNTFLNLESNPKCSLFCNKFQIPLQSAPFSVTDFVSWVWFYVSAHFFVTNFKIKLLMQKCFYFNKSWILSLILSAHFSVTNFKFSYLLPKCSLFCNKFLNQWLTAKVLFFL